MDKQFNKREINTNVYVIFTRRMHIISKDVV